MDPDRIAAALLPDRRKQFLAALAEFSGTDEQRLHLLRLWECRALMDSHGDRDARTAAAQDGTLALGSWDSLRQRRISAGLTG